MIQFKYKPNSGMLQLISETCKNFNSDFIYGILEDESRLQLKNKQLFLVCEVILNKYGKAEYFNPTAVVASSDFDAIKVFGSLMEKDGSVMCKLEDRASNAKVEPV